MTAVAIEANESSSSVMSEASFATEVPEPIERPTLAKLSAGASFVPSPVTATTSPRCCNSLTRRCLSSGLARDMIFRGVVPQPDLAGDFARRGRGVARDDLDADSRLQAACDGRRDVRAHGGRDGGHRREVQPARLDRFEAVVRRGFRPRHGQRAHGAALEPEELFGDLRVLAIRGAHRAHDLRGALHTEDAAARDAAFDDRRHVFAFGREGQPVDDLRFGAQRFVVLASGAHPFEQGPFRGVADDMAFGVEERRGVQGHDLGEFPCGKRVVADQFLHVHAVLGQRAGLVGADDRHGAHRLAGVHFAHEVVGLQHPSHGHRQRQRDRHRKPFGHGHDDDGHRNHEDLQNVLRDGQPVALEQPAREDRLSEHHAEDKRRKEDAQPADQTREARQLTVEGRLLFALHGRLLRDASGFGRIAHGRYDHHAVPVRHGRAAQHRVRGIGRLGVEVGFVDRLVHLGFARERRFVDFQRYGLDQFAVGGNRLAALDVDHVARDHVASRNFADRPFAHHLHGDVVVHLVEPPETPLGVPFEPESDAGGEDDGADDAHRFGEVLVDESDDERQHGGQQEDADDRVAEFFQQQAPGRIVLRRGDDVVAVAPAAFVDLRGSQSFGVVANHRVL